MSYDTKLLERIINCNITKEYDQISHDLSVHVGFDVKVFPFMLINGNEGKIFAHDCYKYDKSKIVKVFFVVQERGAYSVVFQNIR